MTKADGKKDNLLMPYRFLSKGIKIVTILHFFFQFSDESNVLVSIVFVFLIFR